MEKLFLELEKTVDNFNNINEPKGLELNIPFGIGLTTLFCAK